MSTGRGFLSYAHEDWAAAERLFRDLESRGFRAWFDRRDFRAEEDVDAQVLNAIRESYFFLILVSPTSVSKDGYVRKEVKLVLNMIRGLGLERSFIIPVRLGDCRIRPDEVAGLGHYIDMFPNWSEGVSRVEALLPINTALPDIEGASPQFVQAGLADPQLLGQKALALKDRYAISVFFDNCFRRLQDLDSELVSRKIESIRDNVKDFVASVELHFVWKCGTKDDATRCHKCGAMGAIIHGTIDIGGYSQSDYNDNYFVWCTNCYWAYHDFEIDYQGTGPLKFDYATNTYA
ncbi:MAG: toll/interleukin-1 receptor domain-containing protein [Nitrospira sp.]|nr:toll/interleukin-1 receptor domain-containing protein [Nitrospira sp.]